MHLKDLTDYQLSGKRVMLRADMNVPLKHGIIATPKELIAHFQPLNTYLEREEKLSY